MICTDDGWVRHTRFPITTNEGEVVTCCTKTREAVINMYVLDGQCLLHFHAYRAEDALIQWLGLDKVNREMI